jgi:hypothetical protein
VTGWPDVAALLIVFARDQPITFLFTVPLTGIVILAGAFLFLRIVVIRPISMMTTDYVRRRQAHREPPRPEHQERQIRCSVLL